jgi:xanthine dehydrogenase accessory factor
MSLDVHQAVVEHADRGRSFALAVVLDSFGSTPRKIGTKAIIEADGSIVGTVGGGAVEAEAQRRAVEAIRAGAPTVFDFAFAGESAQDIEPICGGTMRILVDPTAARFRDVYAQAAEARARRQGGVLRTMVSPRRSGPPRVEVQWLASAQADEFATHLEIAGDVQALVESVTPSPVLLIAGGGHVGQALAVQAEFVGFDVTVIDDRPEFADPALFPPGVRTLCGDIAGELAALPVAGDTYIAIVTRGHRHDREALAACIRRPAAYIGMIGSRRKVAAIRQDLLASGAASAGELARLCAPIGLDIGAETVPEIAASIVAQLIAVRRGRVVVAT